MSSNFGKRRFVTANRPSANYTSHHKNVKDDRGRGVKRANSPDSPPGNKKRICPGLDYYEKKETPKLHTSRPKVDRNLANNRLKRLRTSLQMEIESKNKSNALGSGSLAFDNSTPKPYDRPSSDPQVPLTKVNSSNYLSMPKNCESEGNKRSVFFNDSPQEKTFASQKQKLRSPSENDQQTYIHTLKTPYNLANSRLQHLRNSIKKENTQSSQKYDELAEDNKSPQRQLIKEKNLITEFNKYKSEQEKEALLDLNIDNISSEEPDNNMDWAEINNKEDSVEVKQKYATNESTSPKSESVKEKQICIVVDTNIFLHSLAILKEIYRMDKGCSHKIMVYVPYMVLTELDYLKDSKVENSIIRNAKLAIAYINKTIKDGSKQMKGQTIFEFEKQKVTTTNADDKILACCLQTLEKYQTVILLSNDMNLKNKAMIHNIQACSHAEILMALQKLNNNVRNVHKVKHKMSILCSYIICECAKEAYGSVWCKMDTLQNPPWGLQDCIKIFKKLWTPVFQTKLMKHFLKALDSLLALVVKRKNIAGHLTLEEFHSFIEQCIEVCVFLKDMPDYRSSVEKTIKEILEIKDD